MKKLIVSILAVFHLASSTGATIHLHFCMGKLVNWDLRHKTSSRCSKCGMEITHKSQNNGCCKDEYKQIKNDKDQKLTETAFNLIHAISVIVPNSFIEIPEINVSSIAEDNPVSNAPPRSQVPIYIHNCVFRI
jgi:hypothetical protein